MRYTYRPVEGISVIIPCGPNRSHLLQWTLWGLRNQTRKPDEILICSNTDDYLPMIEEYKDLPIKTIIELGQMAQCGARNRNNGAKAAQGDLLYFLDSEVVLNPNALDNNWWNFRNFQMRMIASRYDCAAPFDMEGITDYASFEARCEDSLNHIPDNLPAHHPGRDDRVTWDTHSRHALYCDYTHSLMLFGGNLCMHKEIYARVGGYREEMRSAEDGAFGVEACRQGCLMSFDKSCYGWHLWHRAEAFVYFPYEEERLIKWFHTDDPSWIGQMYRSWGWRENSMYWGINPAGEHWVEPERR